MLGSPPTLEWRAVGELLIDDAYQRTVEAKSSQTLIRRIAMFWDWGLCQPLAISRRPDGKLLIVDGQHRASAAKLRGDIPHLPCVITSYANAGDEAAAFVALNQQRRPLNQLDLFKAALAAGDDEATAIAIAVEAADLRIASTTNNQTARPGSLTNVGGLRNCYRKHGKRALTGALWVLAQAYPGQVMRYAGTIFPGIAAIVASELEANPKFSSTDRLGLMVEMVAGATQLEWVAEINAAIAADLDRATNRVEASVRVFTRSWAECCEGFAEDQAA
jgi:hypothetical protein